MPKKAASIHLEKSLGELEALVETMESGKLSLEESLALFEKGVALTKSCQSVLTKTEQKIQILTKEHGQASLTDFNEETE
jgi:exodeoxyribonuclease VII small subunit